MTIETNKIIARRFFDEIYNQHNLAVIDEPYSVLAFMNAGGSSKVDITVQNIKAYSEGSVGWTMDRVMVKLPNGKEMPVRHTRIFHKEGAAWKLVHLHVSIAVPNESLGY